jgi:hypothetical protein
MQLRQYDLLFALRKDSLSADFMWPFSGTQVAYILPFRVLSCILLYVVVVQVATPQKTTAAIAQSFLFCLSPTYWQ